MDYKNAYTGKFPTAFADKNLMLGPMNNQEIKVESNINNIKYNTLIVDSSDRNWNVADTNCYTIEFRDTYNFVDSIELVDGFVPSSGYNISSCNNKIDFKVDDHKYSLRIGEGVYTIITLLEVLEKEMSNKSGLDFKCTLDVITHKVTIKINSDDEEVDEFELLFTDGKEIVGDSSIGPIITINEQTGKKEYMRADTSVKRNSYVHDTIAKVLGFKPINLEGHKSYTGQMVYNIRQFEYVALYINTDKDDDFRVIESPNDNVSGAFAILYVNPLLEALNTTKYNERICDNMKYINYFNPPISFKKIKIEFRSPNGTLYNFNGKDHYLVLRIRQMFENPINRSTSQIM